MLDEPLSFWGGVDPATGQIVDRRHPQCGERVTGRVLVMPSGRGSSSSSTVLVESVRAGTAPAAILLRRSDEILVLGALVAEELYGRTIPVAVLPDGPYRALRTGDQIELRSDGRAFRVGPNPRQKEGM